MLACLERNHPPPEAEAGDEIRGLTPWTLPNPAGKLSAWRHGCPKGGAPRVALTRNPPDGGLCAGSVLEAASRDGEPRIVALLSTDSGPEGHGPRCIQLAGRLLDTLRDPSTRLLFRTSGEGQFHPPGSNSDDSAERVDSVRYLNPITGATGRPWTRLASLAAYAAYEDVTSNAFGLKRVDRPLDGLGVLLGVYRRELDRVMVYQAIVAFPGRRTRGCVRATSFAPCCLPRGARIRRTGAVAALHRLPGRARGSPGRIRGCCLLREREFPLPPHEGWPRACLFPHAEPESAGGHGGHGRAHPHARRAMGPRACSDGRPQRPRARRCLPRYGHSPSSRSPPQAICRPCWTTS